MAEIFSNRPGLDAYARTFENCIPDKDDETVRKGYLYCLYLAADRDLTKAVASLREVLHVTPSDYPKHVLSSLIRDVVARVKKFRSFPRECPHVVRFLQSTSHIPRRQTTRVSQIATADTPTSQATKSTQTSTEHSHSPPSRQLHTDCSKCDHRRKVAHKVIAEKKLLRMQLSNERKKNMLNSSSAGRFAAYRLRHQILVRQMRIDKQRLKRKNKSLGEKVSKLTDASQIKMLKDELRRTKHALRECRRRAQSRKRDQLESTRSVAQEQQVNVETLQNRIRDLEAERAMLKDEIAELKNERQASTVPSKLNNKYDVGVRKACYRCLEHQVPVEAVSSLVKHVVEDTTGVVIDEMPSVGTISNMAYEMGVVSDIYVGQVLMSESNLCLAFDGTTKDGDHINEAHVARANGPSLVLQISALAGGTTEDYAGHIKDALNDIALTQAAFRKEDVHTVKSTVISSLSSTITDRCSVNHCVVEMLKTDLDVDLLELKCNVHPLDGLAHKSRQVLKKVDANLEVKSELFGSDCKAANIIYSLSKMRYKQGKGDPSGFKFFMKKENVSTGLIVRYVGNRLHVIFHLAGVFFFLRDLLQLYLDKYCRNTTSLKTALQKDLRNEVIMMQLRCLGLMGKFLTGPWMREFYANTTKRTNLQMIPHMHKCMTSLKNYQENPLRMLTSTQDVFDNQMSQDSVLTSLQAPITDDKDQEMLGFIMRSLLVGAEELLNRQLEPYLTGQLANPSPEVITQGQSAPPHNIFAEQTLGMVDHQCRRAPNATFGFIDGKVKFIKNGIATWLDDQPEEEQKKVLDFAVGRGREMRALHKKRERVIMEALSVRQRQKEQRKDKSKRNTLQKKVKAVLMGTLPLEELSEAEMTEDMTDTIAALITSPASFIEMMT